MTTRRTISPLTALLLVIGGLALAVGLGIGLQSHSTHGSDGPFSCGTTFTPATDKTKHEIEVAQLMATMSGGGYGDTERANQIASDCSTIGQHQTLAWTLTITGGIALLTGAVLAISARTAASTPRPVPARFGRVQ